MTLYAFKIKQILSYVTLKHSRLINNDVLSIFRRQ